MPERVEWSCLTEMKKERELWKERPPDLIVKQLHFEMPVFYPSEDVN